VIHGGTGLSDTQFRALIERGVAKINYYTALADAAAARMRANAAADSRVRLHRFDEGCAGGHRRRGRTLHTGVGIGQQAAAVLDAARPWREIEHLIIYNFNDEGAARVPTP